MDQEEHIEVKHKKFSNGDVFIGGWKAGLPEGDGKYTWKDGSWYEGGWKEGQKHGIGQYIWPSGASYEGEWLAGCMHGVGTFQAPDGSRFQGGWVKDLKHGLGKKVYANGDVYEGLWKHGKPDGPGRYVWADGNEYDGEWRRGRMHGQGTFVWRSGERYDGEWKEGQEDGLGVFTFRDGSTYEGLWQQGRKHGVGVFRPPAGPDAVAASAAAAAAAQRRATSSQLPPLASVPSGTAPVSSSEMLPDSNQDGPSPAPTSAAAVAPVLPPQGLAPSEAGGALPVPELQQKPPPAPSQAVLIKEYNSGKLVRENVLQRSELDHIFGALYAREEQKRRLFKEPRHQTRMGETIFKGHRSYDLMLNLQLGIRWSINKVNAEPLPKELFAEDFEHLYKQDFPREGSNETPVHPAKDFVWKDYCPRAFRWLRDQFGVDVTSYMMSLCGDQALRQLGELGKSRSVFFLSHDDRFIIKTMKKSEIKLLFELLPKYVRHIRMYPHTLLTRFYGVHRIVPADGRAVRFVVMGNIFRSELQIHRKYDLKGSTVGRLTSNPSKLEDPNTILKDLDLDVVFKLEEGWHDRLTQQIKADCALLEQCQVMDYSLLLGVHYRSGPLATSRRSMDGQVANFEEHNAAGDLEAEVERIQTRVQEMKLSDDLQQDLLDLARLKILGSGSKGRVLRSPTLVLAMRPKRSDTLRPMAHSEGATDELAHVLGQSRVQLGMNMAATAVHTKGAAGAEDVVLYFGVIDILQAYNMTKKVEHAFKSIPYKRNTMSAVDPTRYSKRFQSFLKKVFV